MGINNFSLDQFSLAGKVALVTGGNTGLGEALTRALATAGASVFVVSIMEDQRSVERLCQEGFDAKFMLADITQEGQPAKIVEACIAQMGGLDILVNCAGINLLADVSEFDREPWDRMISINLTAAFEMSHQTAKVMMNQGSGKIINICSVFSFLGGVGSPAYSASKHGLAGLTKAYCDELAQHNIQVNAIAPGYFATDLTQNTRNDPDLNQAVLKHIPAQRWGQRQDLMGAVVFLASAASDYVNGHVLAVDGGYLVR